MYCIPSKSNEAAIDGILQPNRLFQMTVAHEHGVDGTALSNALKQLKNGPHEGCRALLLLFLLMSTQGASEWLPCSGVRCVMLQLGKEGFLFSQPA